MKKILFLTAILGMFAVTSANSQTYVRLKQAAAADTIRASQKVFTAMVNLQSNDLQAVTIGVKADSVSGTPDVKFFLQRSNDGVNWLNVVGDTLTYTSVTTGGSPLIKGGSTYKQLNINPFYGSYARVGYYSGSGAQKSKVWISVRSSTIR